VAAISVPWDCGYGGDRCFCPKKPREFDLINWLALPIRINPQKTSKNENCDIGFQTERRMVRRDSDGGLGDNLRDCGLCYP
jgi:hypothetical protein